MRSTIVYLAVGVLPHFIQCIITQQDPSQAQDSPIGPWNHYYLQNVPHGPDSNATGHSNSTFHIDAAGPVLNPNGALTCAAGAPCIDGSCCGPKNICGFGPDYCGTGCQSGCNATAPCGKYSAGGDTSCGMNLCCSQYGWCGVTEDYCTTSGPSPCQQGFGSCQTHSAFQCDPAAGSATKRSIGYYQGGNVYSPGRVCNQIRPGDITLKYTHLNWAFAEIDPSTFAVIPADPRDEPLYYQFTVLSITGQVQTWIGIGGFDFTTANPHAWSDMVSTAANRQAFITSLVAFMTKYGFQGVDLDWEYPVDTKRGGRPDDMKNLVQLLADMRASPSFGHKFGVSVTLAPDLWYLQYFDAKGLLANADFLGFMSYDLHGTWDADVSQIGKVVLGQTNIHDIDRDLIPLWFDLTPADMAKVNFGLALYGRGYTLADPACNSADGTCYWTAGSKPGPCTFSEGIMSNTEIKALIAEKNLSPAPLGDGTTMMKQITWDDQWMGYDDDETIRQKINYANGHCFGGTMSWSVDLDSGNGAAGAPPISTDGTCGILNGANCPDGQCCSAHGYCGTGSTYCGSGCYSGACLSGGVTTDGSCGVGHSKMSCGGAYPGCCSSAGFCGWSAPYCGNDQQAKYSSWYDPTSDPNKGTDNDPPGDPMSWPRPWESVSCDYKDLPNDGADPALRWSEAQADAAWHWAVAAIPEYVATQVADPANWQFSQSVSQLFHGLEGKECLSVPDVPCDTVEMCGQTNGLGLTCPAGYLIMNSIANIHNTIDNLDQALENALTDFKGGTDSEIYKDFSNYFSKQSLTLGLDIVGVLFGAILAPVWGFAFKGAEDLAQVTDPAKDAILSATAGGLVLAVNQIKESSDPFENAQEYDVIANELIQALRTANQNHAQELFDGKDTTALTTLLTDGVASRRLQTKPQDIEQKILQVLVATMIPIAWKTNAVNQFPFIMNDEGIKNNGNGCSGYELDSSFGGAGIDIRSYACINGKGYWLIMGLEKRCPHFGPCGNVNLIEAVPGLDVLQGDNFGGLRVFDLVASSVNAWTANNHQINWPLNKINPDDPSTLTDLVDLGVQAPGVFNVPVCSWADAYQNLADQRDPDNAPATWPGWPCTRGPQT